MRVMLPGLVPLVLGASVALAQGDAATVANLRGFHFGIDPLTYGSLASDGITGGRTVGGAGIAVRVGWGFSERLALTLDVSATTLAVADTAHYLMGHGDVLLRYTPLARRTRLGTWAPFVFIGGGLRDVTADDASPTNTAIYAFEGEVFTLGAGTSVYVRRSLAILGAYYWSTGDFNDERVGNVTTHNRGVAGRSSRIALGLTWHRGRRASAPAAR
jgi:hypothetical protein